MSYVAGEGYIYTNTDTIGGKEDTFYGFVRNIRQNDGKKELRPMIIV